MFRKTVVFAGVAALGLSLGACRQEETYDTAPPPPATTPPPVTTPPPPAQPLPGDTLYRDTLPGAPGTPGTTPGTGGN